MNTAIINPRQQRGIAIAQRYALQKTKDHLWLVPSSTKRPNRPAKYQVDVNSQKCTCPDFELRKEKCKHIFAVEYRVEQITTIRQTEVIKNGVTEKTIEVTQTTVATKKTYSQAWSAYNRAQTAEKAQFLSLLATLCKGITEPSQANGRPRLPLADMIFSCVYKVFSTVSGRRFIADLSEAQAKGFILETPHFNSVLRYFDKPVMTPILHGLIEQSALPLSALERNFAIDASGLSATHGFTWHYAKYEQPRLVTKKDWLKIHICTGTVTNVVTAVEITEKYEHDSVQFEPLLNATKQNFQMCEVSADKGYLSRTNLQVAVDNGIKPFIAWKANSRITEDKPGNELWNKLYHWYSLNQEKFLESYHRRSNVETTFAMIKAKFSGSIRAKNKTAQANEALAKILCHNICCLIQSMHEFGVKPDFLGNTK